MRPGGANTIVAVASGEELPMRCNVGRYPDGSIYCCPPYISICGGHPNTRDDVFFYSGIIPPPYKIKNKTFRERVESSYAITAFDDVTWKKENGWTHEMIRVVMKTAREMEE